MALKSSGYAFLLSLLVTFAAVAEDAFDIEQLSWMSGCWQADGAEAGSAEIWSMPAGGLMQGMSRFVSGGRAVSTEFIMILEHEGQWVFRAMPSGQARTDFALIESGETTVRFSNPAHDFPQLIEYHLQSGESGRRMLAVISGGEGESQRRIEFPMTAISCDVLMQASQATR